MQQQKQQNAVILERLLKSPIGQQAAKEVAEQQLAERKKLVAQLTALRGRIAQEIVPAVKAYDAAVKTAEDAHRAFLAAAAEAQQLWRAKAGIANEIDLERSKLEVDLRATADPAIDEFLESLYRDMDRIREAGIRTFAKATGNFYTISGKPETECFSNEESVRAALDARLKALELANDLKLEALTPAELQERIATIRAGLPAVGEPTKVKAQ
jgi:hypothetical protein